MSDRPDLYQKCPECEGTGGWHAEAEFCDVCFGDGLLPAEPVIEMLFCLDHHTADTMGHEQCEGLITVRGYRR